MKPQILFIICFLIIADVFSQEQHFPVRYAEKTFDTIRINPDIHYSTAPVLSNNLADIAAGFGISVPDFNIHQGEGKTINLNLYMDLYMPPVGDTVDMRPAIIFMHGGAFLSGSRHDEVMVALCDSFAHLGYVAASIDYRLGMG